MLAQRARFWQMRFVMSDDPKCPMGNHPWLATFLALAFILLFAAKKLGLL